MIVITGWFTGRISFNSLLLSVAIITPSAFAWGLYIKGITFVLLQTLRILIIIAVGGDIALMMDLVLAGLARTARLNASLYFSLLVLVSAIGLAGGGYVGNMLWDRKLRYRYEPS